MEWKEILDELKKMDLAGLYERDFTDLTEKSDKQLGAVFAVADALSWLRTNNYATVIFRSGLGLWEGEKSPEYLAFAAGCAMLGLQAKRVDALREEFLCAAMPDVVCPKDELDTRANRLYQMSQLGQRPLSLPQSPALAALLRLIHSNGGVARLRGEEAPARAGLEILAPRFGMSVGETPETESQRLETLGLAGFVFAAMMLLGKCPDPVKVLEELHRQGSARRVI